MAYAWTPIYSGTFYAYYIMANANGANLFINYAGYSNPLLSSDTGATWTESTDAYYWYLYAVNNCGGSHVYATAEDLSDHKVYVFRSTDYGQNWTRLGQNTYARHICCSGDGSTVYFVDAPGSGSSATLKKSTDSGDTFTSLGLASGYYRQIWCSSDGAMVAVIDRNNGVRISTNGGTDWTLSCPTEGVPSDKFEHITGSNDGSVLYLAANQSNIAYVSTDSGDTWTALGITDYFFGYNPINNIRCSSDGSKVIIAGLTVALSEDTGQTWTHFTDAGATNVTGFVSKDGSVMMTFDMSAGVIYKAGPVTLSIISITPNSGPTAGGQSVTIIGTAFDPAATATIDGNALADLVVVSDTTITGTTPPGTVGAKDVTVTNP